MPTGPASYTFFAVTSPGLADLTAGELHGLGIMVKKPVGGDIGRGGNAGQLPSTAEDSAGGVEFNGSLDNLYRANLCLRTASRVLVRLGDFYAAGFPELRKKTGRLEWERYLNPGRKVTLRVTCHKSRLYHSGAVAERVLAAIADRLGRPVIEEKPTHPPAGEEDSSSESQLVVVRLVHDHCMISIDSSGDLLHRRGYRLATAKAPLRETLAAAMLLAAGWNASSPLVDPFCGSGTIAIEAALLALKIPPGRNRQFAFMRWPGFELKKWEAMRMETDTAETRNCPPIQASDRDAGAVQLALANARRAGVADSIEFTCRAVSAIQPPSGPGWVVTNPPYGLRVSASQDLRNLYAQIGNVLRDKCPGWQVALLCNDLRLLGQTRIKLDTTFKMVNGGIGVRLARGRIEK